MPHYTRHRHEGRAAGLLGSAICILLAGGPTARYRALLELLRAQANLDAAWGARTGTSRKPGGLTVRRLIELREQRDQERAA